MSSRVSDPWFGGLLVAPFAVDAIAALVIFMAVRFALRWARRRRPGVWSHRIKFENVFANPPQVDVAVYVCLVGLLTMLR